MSIPKYSKIEHERRWLMPSAIADNLKHLAHQKIEDLYLDCGRLRLRSITNSETKESVFKLCKKYGAISVSAEPIVNIYLSKDELAGFAILPGRRLTKRRYKTVLGATKFNIDVFENELLNLVLCEIEMDSEEELKSITSPEEAILEVTGNAIFSGGNLSRINQCELLEILNFNR